jgi:hypothetical protein
VKRPALPVTLSSQRNAVAALPRSAFASAFTVSAVAARCFVDLLGVVGGHAGTPGGDRVAVARPGQRRVDRRWWVGRLGRLGARLGHRRVEGHARGGGLIDGVVTETATIDE